MVFAPRDPERFELVTVGFNSKRPARITLTDGTVVIAQVHELSEGWVHLSRFNGIGEEYPADKVERIDILEVEEVVPRREVSDSSRSGWLADILSMFTEPEMEPAKYRISDYDALENAKQDYHRHD